MTRIAGTLALVCALIAGCASESKQTPPEIRILLEAGKYEEGIRKLEEALAKAPDHIEARLLLANTRLQLANRYLAQAAQDLGREAWDDAEAKYRKAADLGAIDQALLGLRVLESGRRQAQLYKTVSDLWAAGKADEARDALRTLLAEYPKNQKAALFLDKIRERDSQAPGAVGLGKAFQKKINLQFRDAPVRAVFEAISRSSGINFTFDKDVSSDTKVTLFLQNTTVESALRNVLLTAQLQQRVVDERTLLVYPNDQNKQREYQQLNIRSFHIANAEAKTVANSLKTLLKARDLVVDEKLNMIVLRDTPETIRMAEKLVALHDVADPEVMLEVEILEVQRSDLESLGVKWPGNVTLSPLATSSTDSSGNTTTASFTLRDLTHLNSSKVAASVDTMKLSASKTRDNVSVLANPRIRIKSREKALIRVGERVPSLSSNVTSTGVTSQSVSYLDVGLKLEAEPVVYLDDEISIKLSLEVSSILETILDSNSQPYGYRIGTRNANTVLRLKDGENQILAGLISDNDKRSSSAIPGLGELPILDRLFGSKTTDRTKTEIVLSITPRLVRNQLRPAAGGVEFDAGTDASLRGRDGNQQQQATPAAPAPAAAVTPGAEKVVN